MWKRLAKLISRHVQTTVRCRKHTHQPAITFVLLDHQIDWQAVELLTPINTWHPRCIREAIEIFKRNASADPYYVLKDLLYPKSTLLHPQTEGSPTVPNPPISIRFCTHPRGLGLSHPPSFPHANWSSLVSTHSSPPADSRQHATTHQSSSLQSLRDPPAVYLSSSISRSQAFSRVITSSSFQK